MNVPSAEALAAGTLDDRFNAAADHIERYMIDGATVGNGAAIFATWHLMSRSLVDLRAGHFLASEGRPIQMASVIRPVLEALNLVELFAREPEAADRWVEGIWREFMPAAVRERLGLGADPVYTWLSEQSHPRFAGLQLTSFRIDRADAEHPVARLYLGGLPLEIPWVLLATLAPVDALGRLSIALGHLHVKPEVARRWPTVARRVVEEVLPGYEAVLAALDRHGVGQELSAEMITTLRTALAHARALEAELQAALEEQHAQEGDDQ